MLSWSTRRRNLTVLPLAQTTDMLTHLSSLVVTTVISSHGPPGVTESHGEKHGRKTNLPTIN